MATIINCDLCGGPGAKAHTYEKRVELPAPVQGSPTARVHIHVFSDSKRAGILDLCDKCREKLAGAPAFVPPPAPEAPKPTQPKTR